MPKLKMILWILLISCLNSCGSNDLEESVDFNQKSVIITLRADENGRRYIDEEKSFCIRRRYRYSLEYIGPTSEGEKLDILKCHKVVGSSPLNYKKKIDWLEAIRIKLDEYLNSEEDKDEWDDY